MDKEIENRILDLCEGFENYLGEEPPFGDWAWHLHRETIEMRKQFRSLGEAIESYDFIVKHIGYTLLAWGMDGRAAQLVPRDKFFCNIKAQKRFVVALERISVSDLTNQGYIDYLWKVIHALNLSQTRSQVVTGAKVLHHLLPGLIPPIDRQYTAKFFTPSSLKNPRDVNSSSHFKAIAEGIGFIARLLGEGYGDDYLTELVGSTPWSTSETKLIDNAIIGYVKEHKLFEKK